MFLLNVEPRIEMIFKRSRHKAPSLTVKEISVDHGVVSDSKYLRFSVCSLRRFLYSV